MGSVVNAVGSLLGGGSQPQAPAIPNYNQAAAATQQSGMYNQNNPYGSISYQQTGTDAYGNPTYTQNQTVAPGLQNAVTNTQNAVSNQQYTPFQAQGLPSTGINPGQSYQQAEMSILQPQINLQNEQSDAQLANQGIMPGSAAYNNAKTQLANNQNNLLANVTTQGIGVGLNANNQAYNQQANTYGLNATTPYNQAAAVKSLATPNFAQTPSGANYNAAAQNTYNAQLGNYNAQVAQNANTMGGLFGLGAAGLMSPTGTFSGLSGLGNLFGSAGNSSAYNAGLLGSPGLAASIGL